jgi:hypothetical protein
MLAVLLVIAAAAMIPAPLRVAAADMPPADTAEQRGPA